MLSRCDKSVQIFNIVVDSRFRIVFDLRQTLERNIQERSERIHAGRISRTVTGTFVSLCSQPNARRPPDAIIPRGVDTNRSDFRIKMLGRPNPIFTLHRKAVADMDKFPGPHSGGGGVVGGGGSIIGKASPLTGCYPISPLHVKRRISSNSNSSLCSAGVEEKMEAKGGGGGGIGMGIGVGSDHPDAGYLPQLRRSEGRGGDGAGC